MAVILTGDNCIIADDPLALMAVDASIAQTGIFIVLELDVDILKKIKLRQ